MTEKAVRNCAALVDDIRFSRDAGLAAGPNVAESRGTSCDDVGDPHAERLLSQHHAQVFDIA